MGVLGYVFGEFADLGPRESTPSPRLSPTSLSSRPLSSRRSYSGSHSRVSTPSRSERVRLDPSVSLGLGLDGESSGPRATGEDDGDDVSLMGERGEVPRAGEQQPPMITLGPNSSWMQSTLRSGPTVPRLLSETAAIFETSRRKEEEQEIRDQYVPAELFLHPMRVPGREA